MKSNFFIKGVLVWIKRFLEITLILIPFECLAAGYERVIENNEGVIYLNRETMTIKNQNIVAVSQIIDLKQPTRDGLKYFKSIDAVSEFNCLDGTHRKIKLTTYSGSMLAGDVIKVTNYSDSFKRIMTNSSGYEVYRIVCKIQG